MTKAKNAVRFSDPDFRLGERAFLDGAPFDICKCRPWRDGWQLRQAEWLQNARRRSMRRPIGAPPITGPKLDIDYGKLEMMARGRGR